MSVPPSLIGTTIGAYEIQALLGSGGMATVYRGFDVNLHRAVAVKVLSTTLATDPAYVERFRQEARLIASLRHPHIAQVYAFGEHAGSPYMVQELLPGSTLEQCLKDLADRHEHMPQQDVIVTVTQLASALDAAHAIGVIHRDVKPSNALYNAEGQIVLTDFGIARSAADAKRTATAAGVVMGTPGYVAPEQAISSAALTPRCDIYALGVVLFELLCGRLPFEADTAMGIVLKHLYDPPPPPTSVRPELPAAIDAVVLRALEKEPTARYSSAGDLAQTLATAWPLAAHPGHVPLQTDIHSQATSVWAARPASMAQPAPTATSGRPPGVAEPVPPAPISATVASPRRSRLLLPLLGLLLIGLLIGGAMLAMRGGAGSAAKAPTNVAGPAVVATGVAAIGEAPTAASTAPITPATATAATPAPPATAIPTSAPTSAPALATVAPALPTAAPVTATEPVASLRAILTNGIAAGQAGDDGQDLLKKLDEVEKAIAKGDQKKASEQLRDLQKKVEEKAREGKLDAALAEQTLVGIGQIASTYGLTIS